MRTTIVDVPVNEITDWDSFHDVFKRVFGFPDFYGRNMDAWIDCMTDLDAPEGGMVQVSVAGGELVALGIHGAADFERRCPEQFRALVECTAFVNFRRVDIGERPILTLLFCDRFPR